jgi:transposase
LTSGRRSSSRSKRASPRPLTARRFGVDRATVKRYCKQLDERGTLEPSKAPSRAPKLDEKARKLLVEDLEQRPWATHSQRAEFLFAVCGVRVSEATVCRTLRRLSHSQKKDQRGQRTRRVLEELMARGTRPHRRGTLGIRRRDGHPHLPGSPAYLRAPWAREPSSRSLGTAARTPRCLRASIGEGWDHPWPWRGPPPPECSRPTPSACWLPP